MLRMSRRAMQLMSDEMGVSSGFNEVFYATLLDQQGMTLGELPPYNVGHVGLNGDVAKQALDSPHNDNKFYHPVKDCGFVTILGDPVSCK